ncbi:MAG: COG3014 family protein [Planctomycetota bacterium]
MTRTACTVALAAVLAAGCASTTEKAAPARAAVASGDLERALAILDGLHVEAGDDAPLVDLERASVHQALGHWSRSVNLMETAMETLEEREEPNAIEWLGGLGLDDTVFPYDAADHEKVLARALGSVSLLVAGEPGDARALALQVNQVQERLMEDEVLEQSPDLDRPGYRRFAFGEYLQAVVDETKGFFDEAAIGYRRAAKYEPTFPGSARELERVKRSRLVEEDGTGAVVVISLTGPGPLRVEREEPVTSNLFLIASAILNSRKGYGVPSQAPVPISWIQPQRTAVDNIEIRDGLAVAGWTETLLDVDAVALRQAQDELPAAVLRAVLRRAFKEHSKNVVKRSTDSGRNNENVRLLWDLAGLLWTASERAETRCWSLLPKRLQVARLELPAGVRTLTFAGRSPRGQKSTPSTSVGIDVAPGRISFVLVYARSEGVAPRVHVDPASLPSVQPRE